MQLIYEGKDITSAVEINKADITDNAGGIADSLEVYFNDTHKIWSSWAPKKNDKVQIVHEGFDSGMMFVDELEQQRGCYIIRALSIPQEAKTHNTKCWEDVRFLEVAGEIASKYGMQLLTYGINDYLYSRLDQNEQSDFEFLAFRCMLEGYMLKVSDNKVVIYDERYMENQDAVKTIYLSDFDGDYCFKSKSRGIYAACRLIQGFIQSEFISPGIYGPTLKVDDIFVSSQAEANRYCINILRYYNKYEVTGRGKINLETGIAAGNNIILNGSGIAYGKYFCEQVTYRITDKKSLLRFRKVLEGY